MIHGIIGRQVKDLMSFFSRGYAKAKKAQSTPVINTNPVAKWVKPNPPVPNPGTLNMTEFLSYNVVSKKKKDAGSVIHNYLDASGKEASEWINWSALSASTLKWPPCEQFINLVHKPDLGLVIDPKVLNPSEKTLLQMGDFTPEYLFAENKEEYKADIAKAADAVGLSMESPEQETKAEAMRRVEFRRIVLLLNEELLLALNDSCYEEKKGSNKLASSTTVEGTREGKINVEATWLAQICGLTIDPFQYTSVGYKFKIGGFECGAEPDIYIIQSASSNLVVIFEDKAGKFQNYGFMGQVVAELVMCHYLNQISTNPLAKRPERVYCIRAFLHYITLFAMEVKDPKQIFDVCDKGDIPTPKIDLYCDVKDPMEENGRGYSLLKKDERKHVVELIAAIRQSILDRK